MDDRECQQLELHSKIGELQAEIRHLRRDLLQTRGLLGAVYASWSWRAMAPMRAASRLIRTPGRTARDWARRVARFAWHLLPLSAEKRGLLAAHLFRTAPALFRGTEAYRVWTENRRSASLQTGALVNSYQEDGGTYLPLSATAPPQKLQARAIAFYLPQFHPIAENNAWWGQGFTEWTKVRTASPRFEGHYQPHQPDDLLGYYDLVADPNVMSKQAELAKLHGIEGFCFYFYWFAGKRLLETPLLNLLNDKTIDLPFCLCWANENWTRRWDGKNGEVLIGQSHSEGDDLAFIRYVSQYLADPRYIRINGRPVLIVYRPQLLPSATDTANRWRQWLRDNGHGEVYLAYTQSFESPPPGDIGFDAAIEFPPHNMGLEANSSLVAKQHPDAKLSIYDWRMLITRSERYANPGYPLFRAVTPSWDNTARRPCGGTVLVNSSPSAFCRWLKNAVRDTNQRFENAEERLIFINAWNEWAEGAHLEPDKRFGFAWLDAVRRALEVNDERKLLIVTHDLRPHGAQYIALNLARAYRRSFGCSVSTLSFEDGPLAGDFASEGPLHIVPKQDVSKANILLADLAERGYRHALVNSAASAWISPALASNAIEHVGLVHELPGILRARQLTDDVHRLNKHAKAIVFPARSVLQQDAEALSLHHWKNGIVRPQGLYKAGVVVDASSKEAARIQLAKKLNLPQNTRFVVGVGYADERKGADIFIDWAVAATSRWPFLSFVWVGHIDPNFKQTISARLDAARAANVKIHFLPFCDDTREFYLAADVYALSSREDPFPSTALEALAAATPVIMLQGAGGIEDLRDHRCIITTAANPPEFVSAIGPWIDTPSRRASDGFFGRNLVSEKFGYLTYAGAISDILGLGIPQISVVVPSYNYARYLEQRLSSILNQTLSPREIIFLDDASTDNSIEVAERLLSRCEIDWRIVRNTENSGNVFGQWHKGADLAKHELLWIAEADDFADKRFLETVAQPFARSDVILSMTESHQVDGDGAVLASSYLDYLQDVSADRWTRAFVTGGIEHVRSNFAIKNTIPNVSAVVFRRRALLDALDFAAEELAHYRVAGDWCVYVNLLREGKMAFSPLALNRHRRHSSSTTIKRFAIEELREIARMQRYVHREFGSLPRERAQAQAYLRKLVRQFELLDRYSEEDINAAIDSRNVAYVK